MAFLQSKDGCEALSKETMKEEGDIWSTTTSFGGSITLHKMKLQRNAENRNQMLTSLATSYLRASSFLSSNQELRSIKGEIFGKQAHEDELLRKHSSSPNEVADTPGTEHESL